MQRISTATKAVDLYGVGKHGFKNGDLALGVLPTDLDAAWFNGLQEEVLAVIEAAGIAPSGASLGQLLLALRSAGVFQTQATNDSSTKAATTAFANPGASLAANGWQKLPSGLIIQWGVTGVIASAGSLTFSLPIAFPNAFFSFSPSPQNTGSSSATGVRTSASQATIYMFGTAGSAHWIAIGN